MELLDDAALAAVPADDANMFRFDFFTVNNAASRYLMINVNLWLNGYCLAENKDQITFLYKILFI
jgi:hypothetical protein